MAHLPTGIGIIVKGTDLDAQDQVEDSTEGDEDTACGGNFLGNVFVHIFISYRYSRGISPPVFSM